MLIFSIQPILVNYHFQFFYVTKTTQKSRLSSLTANFNNMRTPKLKAQATNAFSARYRQSNVRRLLPVSDNCRALFRCLICAERFDYHALGSSWKLRAAAEHFIDGGEKRICRLSFEFRVRMLFKGAVSRMIFVTATYHKRSSDD